MTIKHIINRIFNRQAKETPQLNAQTNNKESQTPYEESLKRFLKAQTYSYERALKEIRNGRKRSHWIWYIFPQMAGLGHSYNSRYYAISCREEAEAYLAHPILGEHLRTITTALLTHNDMQAVEILGSIDAIKVQSCMTLFDIISPNDIFKQVLDTFYCDKSDDTTLRLIEQ